ncbi:MAG: WecB/TagA/CpsF family glycosyltransferase [Ruminococcaceae bacterium]|nr:WecB/TagA/CpsF family glycosyltransferase [Oscillospiraceae bacterium]
MQKKQTVKIMSLPFENIGIDEYLSLIERRLKSSKRTLIFTPNPQILLKCKKDKKALRILRKANILLPDGIGIILASYMLGTPLKERVSGIDVAQKILYLAQKKGFSVFLLGGTPKSVFWAQKNIKKKYPKLNVCGYHHGYFKKDGIENLLIKEKISRASPDILFVCLGFPLQEEWIIKNADSRELKSVKLAMGLGGSIDVWSEKCKRAPKALRVLCLEWLWRAVLEPKRLRILFDIPRFFISVVLYDNTKRRLE